MTEEEHFSALGAPCIKGVGIIIVYDVMRPVADSGEFLCGYINDLTAAVLHLFHNQNPVIFGIVNQIDIAVTSNGMSHGKIIGHHLPQVQRIGQIVVVNDLIVIAVHDEILIAQFGNIGGDA